MVIPILLQGSQMPSVNALPATLSDLSRYNAIRLNDDHWKSDCNLLAGVLKNALQVARSLKEGTIRRYRFIVFALSALATVLSIVTSIYLADSSPTLLGLVVRILSFLPVVNVALVTYLLGNIKKRLDRLSWTIIGVAILGGVMAALGDTLTP